MNTYHPKEKILTSAQLCTWWGITVPQLDNLRISKGLPYVELVRGVYLFNEKRLAQWVEDKMTPKKESETVK